MKKPLIYENRDDYNDFINRYTPGKYDHTLGEYAQTESKNYVQTEAESEICPAHPTGLEPAPKDW